LTHLTLKFYKSFIPWNCFQRNSALCSTFRASTFSLTLINITISAEYAKLWSYVLYSFLHPCLSLLPVPCFQVFFSRQHSIPKYVQSLFFLSDTDQAVLPSGTNCKQNSSISEAYNRWRWTIKSTLIGEFEDSLSCSPFPCPESY